jgi:hypothetical protein
VLRYKRVQLHKTYTLPGRPARPGAARPPRRRPHGLGWRGAGAQRRGWGAGGSGKASWFATRGVSDVGIITCLPVFSILFYQIYDIPGSHQVRFTAFAQSAWPS